MMEPAKSTENLTNKMGNDNNNVHLALIVIAIVVAVVSLIVACVGISLKGTTQIMVPPAASTGASTGTGYDDKIWAIALGHGNYNEAYIDEESGTLKGFLVDITNAVCKISNKNCRVVYDVWTRCWDSEAGQVARGGVGLMSDWYDGCAGWYGTYDRYRTYTFTEPFGRADPESLYVKAGSPLASTWTDLTDKKVGILDGYWTDEFCLQRNKNSFTAGTPLKPEQIFHYTDPPDLVAAVNNGDVDYAFQSETSYVGQNLQRVDGDPVLPCAIQGPGMMTRKVNQDFVNWWNEALKRLKATTEYRDICADLKIAHGHQPGQSPEAYCFL